MGRVFSTTVHIHEWLYNEMNEIAKNSGMTQADAMDELIMRKNTALVNLEAELKKEREMRAVLEKENEALRKELQELREYKQSVEERVRKTISKS